MTPLELLEAPVRERIDYQQLERDIACDYSSRTATTFLPRPGQVDKTINAKIEKCYDAVEDHLNGNLTLKQFHAVLNSLGFNREAVNQAYEHTVDYEAAFEAIEKEKRIL
ncbi:hypothetical protein ACFLZB_01085 [Nanoarchaeota archaeon]